MNGDFSIPPPRDLPPNRLAQRREHLISEIAQPPSRLRLPRRGVVALVAAALIVVVGTASAIGGVRAFILDQGFIGLPPVGATPSTPESGELVIRWLGRTATPAPLSGGPLFRVWVYADGRIIWSRDGAIPEGANEFTSGYLERRLTPEGVELLRSEVVGLLEGSGIHSRPFRPTRSPAGSPAWRCATATGSSALIGEAPTSRRRRGRRSSLRLSDGSTRWSLTRRRCCRRARGPFARSGHTCRPTTQCASRPTPEGCVSRSCPCCRRGPRTCSATRAGHGSTGT